MDEQDVRALAERLTIAWVEATQPPPKPEAVGNAYRAILAKLRGVDANDDDVLQALDVTSDGCGDLTAHKYALWRCLAYIFGAERAWPIRENFEARIKAAKERRRQERIGGTVATLPAAVL